MGPRPRLLALNQYYAPGAEADGRLLAQLCESLVETWDVSVVTGAHADAAAGRSVENGVEVIRVASTMLDRRRLAFRAVNYGVFFALAAARAFAARRPDVVLSYTNPPFVGDLAYAVARRFGAPLVVAVQDVFPETALALGQLDRGPAARVLDGLVRFSLRGADRVVALGETMRRRLEAKGVPPERLRVIPNWVDSAAVRPVPQDNEWSRAHGLAGRFVVMHAGNVGHAQDLDTLVRASALVDERVEAVIVGSGSRLGDVRRLADRLGAPVRFLPHQPSGVISELLSTASVHAVGLARGLAGFVVPSRVYSVMAAGRPVIAAAEEASETAQLVAGVGCGVVVHPGDPDTLATAIAAFADGAYDAAEMGRRGRAYAAGEGSRETAVSRYRELLEDVRARGTR